MKNELKNFFTDYWKYLAVVTACKLNIFDTIGNEGATLDNIAQKAYCNKIKLKYLLNSLVMTDFLSLRNSLYMLNEKSILLTENIPDSLKFACIHWGEEAMDSWQNLDYSIKTGNSAFQKTYGIPYFEYLDEHPDKLIAYHKAMFEYARDDYRNLPQVIDFSIHNTILDCGGGFGAAISKIKECNLQARCILFDRPQVVNGSHCTNIEIIGGDFFKDIPGKNDAILLTRILHDWDDSKASIILKNCKKALHENGLLYVIENATENIGDISFLSLNMAAICESYERTSDEYKALCQQAGFHIIEQKQLNALQTILIFKV